MPDQAILNHAAQILAAISTDQRADAAMRFYFESHRYLQPPAKRVISHAVFAYFRWLSWLDPKASPQKRLEQAEAMHERFSADPKSVKAEALAVLAVPSWLASEMELPPDYLRQLQRDPALWIRARPGQRDALAKSLVACEPADLTVASSEFRAQGSETNVLTSAFQVPGAEFQATSSRGLTQNAEPKTQNSENETRHPELGTRNSVAPDALRFTGTQDLFRTEQFRTGEFEIQDLASQLVGIAAAPQPGQTWWDACAGEGGKTLHLADLMKNKGLVWATDRNARRIETLKRRAARAKLFNYRTDFWDGGSQLPTKAKFDGILLDAPCSGVGTWQRNPHARWTTTPNDVRELAAMQIVLLNNIAGSLKPGGRLVYSVCTLTRSETTAVASAFTAAHPEFEPAPLFTVGSDQASTMNPSLSTAPKSHAAALTSIQLWPQNINANGMFIAAWKKRR